MSRKKWAVLMGGICVLGLIGVVAVLVMTEPSQEERNIINAVNNQQRVIDHNGHIEKVSLEDADDEGIMRFEAEILNESGVPIGKVRGRRIEGFGTIGLRYEFEGEPPDPGRRGRGRRRRD